MGKILWALLRFSRLLGARQIIKQINRATRGLATFTHYIQHLIEWGVTPNPEWYDHFLDQYWGWQKKGEAYPWERGIFSLLAIKEGSKVLELCCGDGFNSHNFYAARASSIVALDFDPEAIKSANKNFKKNGKIKYSLGDIRHDMPKGKFDNIIWDAAIEHFTEEEIASLMTMIKERLTPDGILSGYTLVESSDGHLSHHEHEYEFHSKEDLLRFLTPCFKNVRVFETKYPSRHNLYFYASDTAILPFDPAWEHQISTSAVA